MVWGVTLIFIFKRGKLLLKFFELITKCIKETIFKTTFLFVIRIINDTLHFQPMLPGQTSFGIFYYSRDNYKCLRSGGKIAFYVHDPLPPYIIYLIEYFTIVTDLTDIFIITNITVLSVDCYFDINKRP